MFTNIDVQICFEIWHMIPGVLQLPLLRCVLHPRQAEGHPQTAQNEQQRLAGFLASVWSTHTW